MPVEAEPAPDDAVEAADQEVGEEVGARLVLGAEDLVAVRAREAREAREVGAAVRVRDGDVVAGGRVLDGGTDPLWPVVQLRRDRAHLDVPTAPGGDLPHVQRQRAASHHDLRAMSTPTTSGTWLRTCRLWTSPSRTRGACAGRFRGCGWPVSDTSGTWFRPCLFETCIHPGKASWSTNRSLKSARPE